MNENIVETLVAEILKRLQKKVLLVLTNAGGYQDEIYIRMRYYNNFSFSIMIAENAVNQHDVDKWRQLGDIVNFDEHSLPAALDKFDSLFIPFLDFETMGDVANGIFTTDGAQVINYALMKNINVLALDYNCNPKSELNQVLGLNKNAGYNGQLQTNINKIVSSGVQLCTMNEIESKWNPAESKLEYEPRGIIESPLRYITLNDVINSGRDSFSNNEKLTDLAVEYLKTQK